MPMEVACPSCGQTFTADEKLAGRRAACGVCRSTFEIPHSAAASSLAQPKSIDEAVDRFKLLDWEGAYARAVVAHGVEEHKIIDALASARRSAAYTPTALPEVLVARGIVDEATSIRAMAAVRGRAPAARPREREPQGLYRECPNCFELLNSEWKSCPYCGAQAVQGPELMGRCPSCKAEQRADAAFCSLCGARMDSGGSAHREPGRQCRKCGTVTAGPALICAHCGTAFDANVLAAQARQWGRGWRAWLTLLRGPITLVLVIIACILGYRQLRDPDSAMMTFLHGRGSAALRQRAVELADAVRYGNWEKASSIVDPSARVTAQRLQQQLPALIGEMATAEDIIAIEVRKVEPAGSIGTTYMEVRLKAAADERAVTGHPLADAVVPRGSHERTQRTTWRWRLVESDKARTWVYTGPLM